MKKLAAIVLTCLIVLAALPALAEAAMSVRSINHRGYGTIAPENTLPAYELSKQMGFDCVETDVCFTKDGVAVLLHDGTINRTARNADGSELSEEDIEISDITYEEALAYDFGIWMGEEYKGTPLPTFEAFLDLCAALELHPYIELKDGTDYTREQIDSLVEMVREKHMPKGVTWISFNNEFLGWVRDEDPTARLGFLQFLWFEPGDFDLAIEHAEALRTDTNDVFLDAGLEMFAYSDDDAVSLDVLVGKCRDAGLPLEVWLVNDKETMQDLDPYITGVTSDSLVFSQVTRSDNI